MQTLFAIVNESQGGLGSHSQWQVKSARRLSKKLKPKKCTHTIRTGWPHFESVFKCSAFIIFECSHDTVPKLCWLAFHFQKLSFQTLPAQNVPLYVHGRPIRHILHRLQIMPVPCESSLKIKYVMANTSLKPILEQNQLASYVLTRRCTVYFDLMLETI